MRRSPAPARHGVGEVSIHATKRAAALRVHASSQLLEPPPPEMQQLLEGAHNQDAMDDSPASARSHVTGRVLLRPWDGSSLQPTELFTVAALPLSLRDVDLGKSCLCLRIQYD
jgi:hypothetical protein